MAKRFKAKKKRNFFFLSLSVFVISFAFFLSYFAHLFNTDEFLNFILKSMFKPSSEATVHNNVLDYLLNYTIGQSENVDEVYNGAEKAQEYLADPAPLENKANPLVYLYNTHQGEEYSSNGLSSHDVIPTVMLAGYKLREELNNLDIKTIMETTPIKDVLTINGWNYASSYKASKYLMQDALSKNQTLKYFFDIHRDSISYEASTVSYQNKSYAKVLFVIGTDYDNYNENLSLAEKISERLNKEVPHLSRGILKKGGQGVNGIYNQDFSSQTLLFELGGQYNKISEVNNTLLVLAKVLKEVILENGK